MEVEGQEVEVDEAYRAAVGEVVAGLETDLAVGLSGAEAVRRRAEEGENRLSAGRGKGALRRFAEQFNNALIYVLLASAVVTALLGEVVDTVVICAVVLVNAFVGYLQEAKAEKALAALAAMAPEEAVAVRDGERVRVPSAELVRGDLVVLGEGDKVPADLRVAEAHRLSVDESALTGESVAVGKDPDASAGEGLGDRRNMAFSGTLVTSGSGTGVVTATGDDTELGKVNRLVGSATAVRTPLTRKIDAFTKAVTVAILVLAVFTFAVGVLRGQDVARMVTTAVALAVGAIPEGLPAIVTVTLAFGVARMAARGAIVRRLPAVETLGGTTVVCTDKTGTLTRNEMTVVAAVAGGESYTLSGGGYDPEGEVRDAHDSPVDAAALPALEAVFLAGAACNDAGLARDGDGVWRIIGDPTEGALLVSAAKAGVPEPPERTGVIPFSSRAQYMATLHADGTVYVKGSAERVMARCADALDAKGQTVPLDRQKVERLASALGGRALRVLAFARALGHEGPLGEEPPPLTFLGLQAMQDPPRPEAVSAVAACRTAGIEVKMITGDNLATARAIGGEIGLGGGEAVSGAALAACPDHELPALAARTSVFARVSPEDKLRLVNALRADAEVVAMTGDGVNDAPALKQADIGVAMGVTGTEVAKESADMILTDDDFATVEAAVEEGRGVFDNIVKFMIWALPANLGLGLLLVAAVILGAELPIEPLQVLWLNMTAVLILGLPFAVEPRDPDVMLRPPRPPTAPLIERPYVLRILLVSLILLAGSYGLFHLEQAQGASLPVARTVVVNVFALTLLTYLFACLSLHRPVLWGGVRRNPWVGVGAVALVAIQLAYTYVPFMNTVFRSAPLTPAHWLHAVAVALLAYGAVELLKLAQRPRPLTPSEPGA
ncbi:HAD-IC family P-type ATPase [Actinocorallia sp. A-T 12471]|uniref:cation-translocating P-type ATPase n=1 Tax=Actinocorallia sp. A-T 12471 TaxID=3089813 RepID=UPI0029CCB1A0|nr:HAD-IC family P-type ATPase [Actinocorallia sp. A-T 12471]MDX6744790.1 HAD-IC family P-type ATPase [Actinocorallia sp. A-T 12471]